MGKPKEKDGKKEGKERQANYQVEPSVPPSNWGNNNGRAYKINKPNLWVPDIHTQVSATGGAGAATLRASQKLFRLALI